MDVFVLVKTYELVVDGVEIFSKKREALNAFKRWTGGLTPSRLARRERRNPEEKYSQTKIFHIDLGASDQKMDGTWECDKCLEEFETISDFRNHVNASESCKGASAVR